MMIKLILRIFKIILGVVLSAVLLFNIARIIKQVLSKDQMSLILGFGSAVIISGSMEPTIAPGDIVIIQRKSDYDTGDIVTFKANSYITHRIVEKTADGYITQGDANNSRDPAIEKSRIIGTVITIIPKAGDVILFFRSLPGWLLLIFGLIALIALPGLFRRTRYDS